jgi:hypothetical protein
MSENDNKKSDICTICGIYDVISINNCLTTGKVRGFLCSSCNLLLKNAKDNPSILASAILYLKNHGKKIEIMDCNGRLSSEFLISRNKCCNNGCKNCPY